MMNRSIARKTTLREADGAFLPEQSPRTMLAIQAELNRVACVAMGVAPAPVLRSVARKLPFREFAAQPFSTFADTDRRTGVPRQMECSRNPVEDKVLR